ncbi:TIGR03086 family protein [Modestobacter sp. I12A-02628]|uniref:TIGR03086 family protein n=1 Tax=Goekera deserti TaxID=2497753 RepID=A0A7K3W7T7_9ACTN|nr:TIGR03086 family metal-binding protein [Goekera deserti]MPQ99839.1 TIGR03086 family protein [Goekera deserti]NDI49995.1 TIGR03086 family protein [Goekera deserti]NEL52528.1 TIGR03086 family protein [Goekera deserti]
MHPEHADRIERFQRAQAAFTDLVDVVETGQWDAPSLPGWTVADLVAHLVGEARWVPLLVDGRTVADVGDAVPTDTDQLLDDDPLGAWEAAADAALTAVATPGALDRTVHLSRGPVPATDYLGELTFDLTVHAWDLARALGVDDQPDGELVTAALAVAEAIPAGGMPGLFDAPVEARAGATPLQQLLARTGRRP